MLIRESPDGVVGPVVRSSASVQEFSLLGPGTASMRHPTPARVSVTNFRAGFAEVQ